MFAKFIARLFAPLFTSPEFVAAVAKSIDTERLAKCVPPQRLADYIVESSVLDYDEIADRAAKLIQSADVASHVDLDDIAERAAENIDLDEIAEKAAENIDVSSVAENVEKGRDFVKAVAEAISLSNLAGELDYKTLTRKMDIDYSEIATNVSYYDLGNECVQQLDMEEIASTLSMADIAAEISMCDLVNELDMSSLAEEINYADLAEALLARFVQANDKANGIVVRPSAS